MTLHEYKSKFLKAHNEADWRVETSPMNEYGRYYKEYIFSDGASMIEVNMPVYEKASAEVEVKGMKVTIEKDIKLLETEIWNTDDAKSYKFYELW